MGTLFTKSCSSGATSSTQAGIVRFLMKILFKLDWTTFQRSLSWDGKCLLLSSCIFSRIRRSSKEGWRGNWLYSCFGQKKLYHPKTKRPKIIFVALKKSITAVHGKDILTWNKSSQIPNSMRKTNPWLKFRVSHFFGSFSRDLWAKDVSLELGAILCSFEIFRDWKATSFRWWFPWESFFDLSTSIFEKRKSFR